MIVVVVVVVVWTVGGQRGRCGWLGTDGGASCSVRARTKDGQSGKRRLKMDGLKKKVGGSVCESEREKEGEGEMEMEMEMEMEEERRRRSGG